MGLNIPGDTQLQLSCSCAWTQLQLMSLEFVDAYCHMIRPLGKISFSSLWRAVGSRQLHAVAYAIEMGSWNMGVGNCTFKSLWHEPIGSSCYVMQRFMLHNAGHLELRHWMKQTYWLRVIIKHHNGVLTDYFPFPGLHSVPKCQCSVKFCLISANTKIIYNHPPALQTW